MLLNYFLRKINLMKSLIEKNDNQVNYFEMSSSLQRNIASAFSPFTKSSKKYII